MNDVFISYADEDRKFAEHLAQVLHGMGWSVWWDRLNLGVGDNFWKAIADAIDDSKCVVVLWSRHSVGSDWVWEEANRGYKHQMLLPAFIEKDIEPPMPFGQIQAADLSEWNVGDSSAEFEKLAKRVEQHVGSKADRNPSPSHESWRWIQDHRQWLLGTFAIALALLGFWGLTDQKERSTDRPAPPSQTAAAPVKSEDPAGANGFRNTLSRYVAEAPSGFTALGAANQIGGWVPLVKLPNAISCRGHGPSGSAFIECVLAREKNEVDADQTFGEVVHAVDEALPGWTNSQMNIANWVFRNSRTPTDSTVSVVVRFVRSGADYDVT